MLSPDVRFRIIEPIQVKTEQTKAYNCTFLLRAISADPSLNRTLLEDARPQALVTPIKPESYSIATLLLSRYPNIHILGTGSNVLDDTNNLIDALMGSIKRVPNNRAVICNGNFPPASATRSYFDCAFAQDILTSDTSTNLTAIKNTLGLLACKGSPIFMDGQEECVETTAEKLRAENIVHEVRPLTLDIGGVTTDQFPDRRMLIVRK